MPQRSHLMFQHTIARCLLRGKIQPFEIAIDVNQSVTARAEQMVMGTGVGIVAQPASTQVEYFRQCVQSDQSTQHVVDGGPRDARHHSQNALIDLVNRRMAIIAD